MRIIRSDDRGRSQYGWLDSRHTFSFADYYDPDNKGVSVLRVINDDLVAPGTGFETHSHRDVEIISYILEGAIEHKDSMGNITRLVVATLKPIFLSPAFTTSLIQKRSVLPMLTHRHGWKLRYPPLSRLRLGDKWGQFISR